MQVRPSSEDDSQSSADRECSFGNKRTPKEKASPSSQNSTLGSPQQAAINVEGNGALLEYKAISWRSIPDEQDASDDSLTINLALWWLIRWRWRTMA